MGFMAGEWRLEARIRTPNGYLVGSGTMDARFDEDGNTTSSCARIASTTMGLSCPKCGSTKRREQAANRVVEVGGGSGRRHRSIARHLLSTS
jgi:hypothetical protein